MAGENGSTNGRGSQFTYHAASPRLVALFPLRTLAVLDCGSMAIEPAGPASPIIDDDRLLFLGGDDGAVYALDYSAVLRKS